MTDQQAQQIVAQYQSALERKAAELSELRQLRQVVNLFLNRQASFAELRQAASQAKEVQS